MKRVTVIAICLFAAGLLWVHADQNQNLNDNPNGGFAQPTQWVKVVNWPDEQIVGGAVEVTNLPAEQAVTGTVNIANLPPIQQVEVLNLPTQPQRFRFVGVTTQKFQGNGTRAAMNAACFDEYPGSRVAFADEVTNTIPFVAPAEMAWVEFRPIVLSQADNFVDAAGNLIQFSGLFQGGFNCGSWQQNASNRFGVYVLPTGGVGYSECDNDYSVGCSFAE